MNLPYWLNTAWMWRCRGELCAFHHATYSVEQTQAAVLNEIISRNQACRFGESHQFRSLSGPADFQRRVPLSTYEAYAGPIEQIAAGDLNVLTTDPVRLLEPTSGSTGGEKLIPFTTLLREQFQRAIRAWIGNLMRFRPAARDGRAYWSISPSFGQCRRTSGGLRIGFDDDIAYLGHLEQCALRQLVAVPPSISTLVDIENFRYCTLLHLLRTHDLALVSIWNPTFLTALLDPLKMWLDRICSDLRHGKLSWPNPTRANVSADLVPRRRRDGRRADELESIFASQESLADCLRRVWPKLAIISCWTDAAAARYAADLRAFFPTIEVQSKGLVATEGCVSFPLVERTGSALAIRSHFFEFEDCGTLWDDAPSPESLRLAHELEDGGRYRVVLTTGGGLYRYRLGDIVEVVGFENQCPLVRFLGRADQVSDLVGEKLAEPHVREVLEGAFAAHGVEPRFAMVVPVDQRVPHYRLLVQTMGRDVDPSFLDSLASSVQRGLEQNPYYRHAVAVGQLTALDVCVLDECDLSARSVHERACVANGQKAGDVKPTVLGSWTGWAPRKKDRGAGEPELRG